MTAEERALESVYKKIRVLEKRLSATEKINTDQNANLIGLFPPKTECLYFYLLGDAYFLLRTLKAAPSTTPHGHNVDERCLLSYQSGVTTAAACLEIVEPLRLLCIYSWCNALIHIKGNYRKARSVADQTFNQASLHTNTISKEAINLLQRLRDDIVLSHPKADAVQGKQGAETRSEANSIDNVIKAKPPTRNIPTTLKTFTEDTPHEAYNETTGSSGMGTSIPSQRREVAQCALAVRRIISLPVPVQLDTVSSASLILKALDKIFRTYVRGTALPGQLSGGNTVDFDGTTLTFRNFILHGPYISWKGFVHFLLDFTIASPPALGTKLGRNFLSDVLDGNRSRLPGGGDEPLPGGAGGGAGKGDVSASAASVTMLEAAVCFVESSKSITPALVLSKFLKIYQDMAKDIEGDPWVSVHAWAEEPARQDWDIKSGVNFMQFVDCLGKLGMVAYKGSRYTEMLPTASDKMEHFLSAHLGLTDPRKWQRKVENKLRKIKSVIKEVGLRSPPKRPGTAVAKS